jgi:hypothetical protein
LCIYINASSADLSDLFPLCSIKERSDKRAVTAKSPVAGGNSQAEKIGYVPRAKVGELKETGYSSRGGRKGEALDDESRAGLERVKAADADIDQDLDSINQSLASLGNIAGQMRDEVRTLRRSNCLDIVMLYIYVAFV